MVVNEALSIAKHWVMFIALIILAITLFGAPSLLFRSQAATTDLLDLLLSSRTFLGGGFIRRWFLTVHLLVACSVVPVLIGLFVLSPQALRKRVAHYQQQEWLVHSRTVLSARFFAAALLVVVVLFGFTLGTYLWFSHQGKLIIFPVFMAISYLTILTGVFTLSLTMSCRFIFRRLFPAAIAVISALTILELPLFLTNPATEILNYISPYYYATYMLRVGPGSMPHFVHTATILFLFILVPYIAALRFWSEVPSTTTG